MRSKLVIFLSFHTVVSKMKTCKLRKNMLFTPVLGEA